MNCPKPTILFIHGASHSPVFYGPIIQKCQSRGYEAICPQLPTCDPVALEQTPNIDMQDDAKTLETILDDLINKQGKNVMVVAHSYGSVPITQILTHGLCKRYRETVNKVGGVVSVLHVCGLLVSPGSSLESLFGGQPAPYIIEYGNGMTIPDNPADVFLNDMDLEEQRRWSSKKIPQPRKAHSSILPQAAYGQYRMGYVLLENDHCTPFDIQQIIIQKTKDAGIEIEEYHLQTGHSPYLSQQDLFLEILDKFMTSACSHPKNP